MNFKLLLLIPVLFSIFASCGGPTYNAEKMAKKWCECNKPIVPLQKKLKASTSPEQRYDVLDSMKLVGIAIMSCMGTENIEGMESKMSNAHKDKFNKVFRNAREESCPEVFQAISEMEEDLKNYQK